MRRVILSVVAGLLMTTGVFAQTRDYITIKGKVNFPPNKEHQEKFPFALKDKPSKDGHIFQKIELKADSTYEIKVPNNKPGLYSLDVYAWDRITFWVGNDDLKIDFRGEDTARVKIKNPPFVFIESEGKENQLINMLNWENYQNYQNTIAIGKRQYMASQSKDTAMTRSLTDMMMQQYDNMEVRAKWYVRTFKNDPQVVYALGWVSPRRSKDFILEYVNPLIVKYPWLKEAQEVKDGIIKAEEAAKKTVDGAKFINITQLDPNGKKINLYDYLKGKKYVLVDFWASWCGPCRAENPHVLKVYNKYKAKGFDVFAISLDDSKDRWVKAIKDDNMPWAQVSDLKGWKNEAAQYYNITAIPMNYLLDANGNIVAKNLRGDNLEKEIAKLLDK
ncbi:MAG: TlpA family protein disulfide reductase [Sphingobacterium sp.]|jgi:thiol-disulfide isomerase/thioredoxin|nr:TlpA family protein disulfide reductase [Sphingobacterium sp.]